MFWIPAYLRPDDGLLRLLGDEESPCGGDQGRQAVKAENFPEYCRQNGLFFLEDGPDLWRSSARWTHW